MRIAICDDEEVQQQLLRNYLEEWAALNEIVMEIKLFHSGEHFLFLC